MGFYESSSASLRNAVGKQVVLQFSVLLGSVAEVVMLGSLLGICLGLPGGPLFF